MGFFIDVRCIRNGFHLSHSAALSKSSRPLWHGALGDHVLSLGHDLLLGDHSLEALEVAHGCLCDLLTGSYHFGGVFLLLRLLLCHLLLLALLFLFCCFLGRQLLSLCLSSLL